MNPGTSWTVYTTPEPRQKSVPTPPTLVYPPLPQAQPRSLSVASPSSARYPDPVLNAAIPTLTQAVLPNQGQPMPLPANTTSTASWITPPDRAHGTNAVPPNEQWSFDTQPSLPRRYSPTQPNPQREEFAPPSAGGRTPLTCTPNPPLDTNLGPESPLAQGVVYIPPSPAGAIIAKRFRTKLCDTFVRQGFCHFEHRCMFAHGQSKLRSTNQNLREGLTTELAIKQFQHNEKNLHRALANCDDSASGNSPLGSKSMVAVGRPELRSLAEGGAVGGRGQHRLSTPSTSSRSHTDTPTASLPWMSKSSTPVEAVPPPVATGETVVPPRSTPTPTQNLNLNPTTTPDTPPSASNSSQEHPTLSLPLHPIRGRGGSFTSGGGGSMSSPPQSPILVTVASWNGEAGPGGANGARGRTTGYRHSPYGWTLSVQLDDQQ